MLRQFATALAWCSAAAQACPSQGAGPAVLQPVLPGLWVHHGHWPSVHADGRAASATTVVLAHGGQATLVDPGPSECSAQALQQALAGQGLQVVGLVNTHAHAEQVLANGHWPVPVAATEGTQRAMQARCPDCLAAMRHELGEAAMAGSQAVLPTVRLRDGQLLQAGGRQWQVLEMPGAHTESDLVLWSSDGVLLAGGLIDGRPLVLAQGQVSGWLDALARLQALAPRWLIGQHRVAGPGEVRQVIQAQREALCTLVRRSWQALENWQTESQLLAQLPWLADAQARRQQQFNQLRAWREMEARWLGREPLPAACADQPQTSGGN